ncbi:insulin-like growth factor 2 mRNA-binding protein 2 [Hydractinia symbiolongicarpus]|uniref:insulin-like growth factor 2 mRNA-binding protein 2 n=1 Tax=Hydractinia symbiolongicarpus TaxID=13093 RepID=UPI0025505D71|nr:insulin-like growth factor 2 mRNA-binding protein 2 [Hydractinia symbiolongicarpus]
MPQLLFQFQHNGVSKDGPFLETLIHILNQRKITYDGIQKHQHSDAVSVDFSSPEEAKNAYKTLDGMELMGSYLTIKPGRSEESSEYVDREQREQQNRTHYHRRKEDQSPNGYSEQRNDRRYRNNDHYNTQYNDRYNDRYSQYNMKQTPTVEQYPCRILIPSDMVKVILGKAGATITSIQGKTNTKIDIHRDKGPMRGRPYEDTLTTIKGDPTSFSDAIKELLVVMQTDYEKREEDECKPLQLKLLAHDLLCGRIIGKAGNNLKKVRNDSGVTKLIISNSIYEESNQFSPSGVMCTGERVITIEGTVDAICAAEVVLSKRLRDYMERDMSNSANMTPGIGGGMGYFGGAGGGAGGGMSNSYNYPPNMMYQRSPYGYPNMAYMGGHGYPGYIGGYNGILGHGYVPNPFGGNLAPQPQSSNDNETTCVLIPTKEVGAIIGRNGGYINRVKQYSGAQVRVVKGEEGGESRVEITGPPDAQWKASLCVFSKIKETMKVPYSEAQLRTEYMVSGECVGRIIGKKGQVVQDIQDKAQADIEVPKDKQGGEQVPVFITGTFNGTQIALNRIRDIVHRAQQKST